MGFEQEIKIPLKFFRKFLHDFLIYRNTFPDVYRECPQCTGTNPMGMYEGTSQVYAVTAGSTVPAAFAGVHRNHHFALDNIFWTRISKNYSVTS